MDWWLESTFNSDNHGNTSDAKTTVNVGLTGEVVENSGLKTGYGAVFPHGEQSNANKGSTTTSFSFGQALIIGWEVKFDFTKKDK